MSEQRVKIPRATDRLVVDAFKEVGALYGISLAHISALGFSNLGKVNISEEPGGDLASLLDLKSTLIDSISMQLTGMGIAYHRGGKYPVEQKSPVYDEIVLTQNQQGELPNAEKLKIVALLNKKLKAFEPGRIAGKGISEEQNQLAAIHESTLERLEQLNEDLIRQSSEFRKNLELQFTEKQSTLEEGNTQQRLLLEEEFKSKTAKLLEKEKQLQDKLDSIDDRDNTHVRREIRDKMLDDVKNRIDKFGVSESTAKKRGPVLFGMFLLISSFVALLAFTAYEIKLAEKQYFFELETMRNLSGLGQDKLKAIGATNEMIAKVTAADAEMKKIYWLWARFALYSMGLIGTILYYIKWQNKWAEQHSNSEFQLQQFYIDVNRANWVIESCLEWRKETQSVLPKTLIEGISRNLFVKEQAETEKVIHPADQLASALLGKASKVKLRLGENEIDFDKPGKISNKPIKVKNASDTDT